MPASESDNPKFECWGILELMGHRRLAGRISEETIAGHGMIRVDIPELDPTAIDPDRIQGFTQFYSPEAIYCFTPTTEEVARRMAQAIRQRPIAYYEMPAGLQKSLPASEDDLES